MKNQYSYTYTVLRYVHDVTSGEFVNVGVALYAPQAHYLSAICRTTYGRLNKIFPGVNAEHFKALMRHIQNSFERRGESLSSELALMSPSGVLEIAQTVQFQERRKVMQTATHWKGVPLALQSYSVYIASKP